MKVLRSTFSGEMKFFAPTSSGKWFVTVFDGWIGLDWARMRK